MSSINNLSSLQSAALVTHKCDTLSLATKMRLEALGIDPSNITSEAQAQIIIAQVEAAQNQNNSGREKNSSREELFSEAKALAQAVGVSVSSRDSLENILRNIENALNIMAQDESQNSKVKEYKSKLSNIAQRANIAISIQQNIFNEMNMISISNRLILGLG